jgi:hypothetical protein
MPRTKTSGSGPNHQVYHSPPFIPSHLSGPFQQPGYLYSRCNASSSRHLRCWFHAHSKPRRRALEVGEVASTRQIFSKLWVKTRGFLQTIHATLACSLREPVITYIQLLYNALSHAVTPTTTSLIDSFERLNSLLNEAGHLLGPAEHWGMRAVDFAQYNSTLTPGLLQQPALHLDR